MNDFSPFSSQEELDEWLNAPLESATEDCVVDKGIIKFKCKNCGFIDLVPKWCVDEDREIEEFCTPKIIKLFKRKKSIPELICPNCNNIMIPLSKFKN